MCSPLTAQPPISRRGFLGRSLLTAAAAVTSPRVRSLRAAEQAAGTTRKPIDQSSLTFLKELAAATIESARVRPGQSRGGTGPNNTGITLITPGGNYPALWTRDFAMSLDCGLISAAGDTAAVASDRPMPERRAGAAVAQRRDHSAVRDRGSRQPGWRGGVLSGHLFLGRRPGGAAVGAVAADRRSFLLHPHRLPHRATPATPNSSTSRLATAAFSTAWRGLFARRLPIRRPERRSRPRNVVPLVLASRTPSICWGQCRSRPCCDIARPGN